MKLTTYITCLITIFCFKHITAQTITKPTAALYGFIENKGQIIDQNNNPNPSVLYLYTGNGLNVQLKKEGFSYEVVKTKLGNKQTQNPKEKFDHEKEIIADTFFTHRIDISFVNVNPDNSIVTGEPLKDYINYYTTATSEQGVINVKHFNKITYKNIYKNIDIEFVLNDKNNCGNFKYNIIVYPGGNPNDIQLKLEGANQTTLTKEGSILIATTQGNIEEQIPYSYQVEPSVTEQSRSTEGQIKTEAKFFRHPEPVEGQLSSTFGISVPTYNPTQTLIIDPAPWATYYGSSSFDIGSGVTLDSLGNIIMVGFTGSSSTIATTGAYQTTHAGGYDAMVVKFNNTGARQWATYYGGSGDDKGNRILTDSGTNLIFVGNTSSTSVIATSGAHQITLGGGYDAFVVKLNGAGLRQWATYYGGTGNEYGFVIAIDSNRNIFITGSTTSTANIAITGAHQQIFGGAIDAFLVKFNAQGLRQWATYYGGSVNDEGNLLAIDKAGNVFAGGYTNSTTGIATSGAHQSTFGGAYDAYFAKFNSLGVRQWATYYGGNSDEVSWAMTLDSGNNVLITGRTYSTNGIATSGAFKTVRGGSNDIFIAKLNALGVRQWGTYYGGNDDEEANDIKCDRNGNIYITGSTLSDTGITTLGTNQSMFGGNWDAFLAKFNPAGNRLWGTYYGGSDEDYSYGLVVSPINNDLFITGSTASNTSIATTGAFRTTFSAIIDAFLAAFTSNGSLPVKLVSFDAKLNNESKVLCSWATASEINNNYFEVERSLDNKNWLAIGKVNGAGNSNKIINYYVTDNLANPVLSLTNGATVYYRLKQTDFDGTSSLSPIKTVQLNDIEKEQIQLYYYQNTPTLQFISNKENEIKLKLYGLSGNILWQSVNTVEQGTNTIGINTHLQSGIYLLQFQLEDKITYFKVFINNKG